MKWFKQVTKSRQEAQRQEEISYRVKLADVRRQAERMRKDAAAARNEAYRLEKSGDHAAAVSKAMEAANNEKAYKAAQETLRRCETMHAQAKTQRTLMNLLTDCEAVSRSVIGQIDTEGAAKAQEKLQQTNVMMEEVQEGMQAFQDGFEPMGLTEDQNMTGEDELAAILAEHEEETRKRAEAILASTQQRQQQETAASGDRREWLAQRRRELAEIG